MNVKPDNRIIYFRETPTKLIGGQVALVHGNPPQKVGGGPNQKQIAISNPATANSIYVYEDPGRGIIQEIFPRTSWTFVTSGDIYIASSGTGDFTCYFAKSVYTNDLPG